MSSGLSGGGLSCFGVRCWTIDRRQCWTTSYISLEVAGLPRPERPLDNLDDPLVEFAAGLRKLRAKAGNPTYRALARRANFSVATLAAAGRGSPVADVAGDAGVCRCVAAISRSGVQVAGCRGAVLGSVG
jgi:hypothetical protein